MAPKSNMNIYFTIRALEGAVFIEVIVAPVDLIRQEFESVV